MRRYLSVGVFMYLPREAKKRIAALNQELSNSFLIQLTQHHHYHHHHHHPGNTFITVFISVIILAVISSGPNSCVSVKRPDFKLNRAL